MIPEFTTEETQEQPIESGQSPETITDEVIETEKGTPSIPQIENQPDNKPVVEDIKLNVAVQALQEERTKLLREIADLRGQRREIKEDQIRNVEQTIDELKDVNPQDVEVVEKILRGKGYVPKQEVEKMFYETVKKSELDKFLDQYPEYKPENDKNNVNWSSLQSELYWPDGSSRFATPKDPHLIGVILRKAHQSVTASRGVSDRSLTERKKQIEHASIGSGGSQRSSSLKTLDPERRLMLSQGGWSEEEIKSIEAKLT